MASTPRKGTKSDDADYSLTTQQLTAIDLLATGKNLQDTADTLGVQRSTVSVWTHHHLGFQAMLNQRRQELWQEMIASLRALVPEAVAALQAELQGENRLQAATTVLRVAGLYNGVPAPSGATAPEEIAAQQEWAEAARQEAAQEAEIARKERAQQRVWREFAIYPAGGAGPGGQD